MIRMRFVACRLLFAVVLVALSCRTAMAQAGAQMLTVRGTITDNQTRTPVSSAVIQLVDSAGRRVVSTVSNADGLFHIAAPANTRYTMRIERLGYFTAERDIGRSIGPDLSMQVQISPRPILLDSMLVPGVAAAARALGNTEQLLHGRLLDDRTREPIAGGTIELMTDNGRKLKTVTTDAYGLFRLVTPRPGSYVVRAARMGYRTADSPVLKTILGDTIRFNFNLLTDAVLLAPIVVTASARDIMNGRKDQTMLAEFYGRMARFEKSGFGQFMTRDSLANYEEYYDTKWLLTHKFFIEGGAHRRGSSCGGDRFYLNGGQFHPMDGPPLTDLFSPGSLEAIEVYRAPRIPAEFMSFGMPPCTVVALWTRL
jgi:hypothetical protein